MNTCDTCKHWDRLDICDEIPDDTLIRIRNKQHRCICPKVVWVTHEKDHERIPTYTYWRDIPDDGAGYEDGEDYHATFAPGPKFGCIHHEATP